MPAWIHIEDVSVTPWAMSVVYVEYNATPLSSADAQQATNFANDNFREYVWHVVPKAPENCIVMGVDRPKKK